MVSLVSTAQAAQKLFKKNSILVSVPSPPPPGGGGITSAEKVTKNITKLSEIEFKGRAAIFRP